MHNFVGLLNDSFNVENGKTFECEGVHVKNPSCISMGGIGILTL